MIFWLSAAWAQPQVAVVRVPFPTSRVFRDVPDRVCLQLPLTGKATSSLSQMHVFEVDCRVADDWMTVCLTLTEPEWPDDLPPVTCGPDDGTAVRMRPVKAYDPSEDIWDGVGMLQVVDAYKAVFHVDHPDTPGILRRGECGIREGLFWFDTTNPERQQECILVMADGSERRVPIRLLPRLRRVGN